MFSLSSHEQVLSEKQEMYSALEKVREMPSSIKESSNSIPVFSVYIQAAVGVRKRYDAPANLCKSFVLECNKVASGNFLYKKGESVG
jgi:hypothetical protein